MIGIIDTSSLIAIARYYAPLKDQSKILTFLEEKFRSGELILLSTIHREASRSQKGIAIISMPFLNDDSLRYNDDTLFPPAPSAFSKQLDNNFCVPIKKKVLTTEAYDQQKNQYMTSGDAKLIFYAQHHICEDPVIITEETSVSNDGKLFKKLPPICDFLKIKHQNITQWLADNGIQIQWHHPSF